ncbi:hypothetical protein F5B22DRAFT_649892 [Xylaria bambusicola]|uniref:uncharacterized protein n=1 Tax=Xylaria bambusicola TaxID=326684 RepID=UPI0020083FEA|nr:uncharacterized protein F5B22DRAFT_649892 [Xylaria bambusicola]KAI0508595.1 hypothetical protein F5B22DRAFT_649892 [Xylaria bambusicola]
MSPKPLTSNNQSPNFTNSVDPHIDEMSDLIFSFDNDIDLEHGMINLSLQQSQDIISLRSSPPSSLASQSGYATISYQGHSPRIEHPPTELYKPDASKQEQIIDINQRRQARPLSPNTSSVCSLSLQELCKQSNTQQLSSSHLLASQQYPHSPTPEPTTPRTKRFQSNMLSMLSLLPPGRYLSPSPSVEEHQFEDEGDVREYDGATRSPSSPIYASATFDPSNISSSCSSYLFLESSEDLKRV